MPTSRTGAPPHRYPHLDGVRGLAALMVALSHFTLAFQPALMGGGPAVSHFAGDVAVSHTTAVFFFNPELGVAIFFVLSGFVLAAAVASKSTGLAELVARRWVRLALPILGTSLLIWPLAQFHLFRSVEAAPLAKSDWLGGNYGWLAFQANDLSLLVWQSLVDIFARSRHFWNTALWTMPTEFWGSVGLFSAYAAIRWTGLSARRRPAAGLALALAALGLLWRTSYFGFPCGVALFELRRLIPGLPRTTPLAGAALLVVGVLLGGMPYFVDIPFGGLYAHLLVDLAPYLENPVLLAHRVGAVCLVAAALCSPPLKRWLETRVCQHLGRVSFMLYLVHVPLLCSVAAFLVLRLTPWVGYGSASLIALAAFLATALGVAEFATRAFDAPAIRLSRAAGALVGQSARRIGEVAARGLAPRQQSGSTTR